MPKEVSYSDAREHFKTYLDYVTKNSDILTITRKNGDDVVMIAKSDYEALEETLYLLSSAKNRKHLAETIDSEGKGEVVTINSQNELNNFFS